MRQPRNKAKALARGAVTPHRSHHAIAKVTGFGLRSVVTSRPAEVVPMHRVHSSEPRGSCGGRLWRESLVQVQDVALMAVGGLAQASHDAARLGIDLDLGAVHQVRALPRLAAQLVVGIRARA
jgi:hypothetical protein